MRRSPLALVLAAVVGAAACARTMEESGGDVDVSLRDPFADVAMRSATGASLGTLRFTRLENGAARLVGTLNGIPDGIHGIHVHEVGRCDAPGFESAGAHLNPTGRQHGLENPHGAHAGDAKNIEANAAQRALVDVTFPDTSITRAANGLFDANGSAVVVHEKADDQQTDPSGNSGARIACGVVAPR
jgi:Cu-Zn family superoxide dismutase